MDLTLTRTPAAIQDNRTRTLSVAYFDGIRYPHLARIDGRPDTLALVLKPRAVGP